MGRRPVIVVREKDVPGLPMTPQRKREMDLRAADDCRRDDEVAWGMSFPGSNRSRARIGARSAPPEYLRADAPAGALLILGGPGSPRCRCHGSILGRSSRRSS